VVIVIVDMKIDGRTLSSEEQYLIRRIAAQRYLEGESPTRIAASYGTSVTSVHRWGKTARERGLDALAPRPKPGRPRKLTPDEEQEVFRWVVGRDPRQLGLDFGLWTRKIIAEQIEERLGVSISITGVGEMLHRLGLSPQKPLRRAYERDETAIKNWVCNEYPRIKKQAKRAGAEIFWLDEAGVRSDDPLQRTWGLVGKTPVVQTSSQRQSINVISALSNNGGFWFMAYSGRFNADKFIECLHDFMRYRRRPVVMIMDGHPVHKAKKVLEYIKSMNGRLKIELLPPYAPEHNPDEYVFNYMKTQGVTKKPLKKGESLKSRVIKDLEMIKGDRKLVKSFFKAKDVTFAAA
jgi:transposase